MEGPNDFEGKSQEFVNMEADPEGNKALQTAALEYMKTKDQAYLNAEGYTGELDPDGYMLNKDGGVGPRPLSHFRGSSLLEILDIAKSKLG